MPAMHGPSTNTCRRDEKGSKCGFLRFLKCQGCSLPSCISFLGAQHPLWGLGCGSVDIYATSLPCKTSKWVGSYHLFHLKKLLSHYNCVKCSQQCGRGCVVATMLTHCNPARFSHETAFCSAHPSWGLDLRAVFQAFCLNSVSHGCLCVSGSNPCNWKHQEISIITMIVVVVGSVGTTE